MGKVNKIHNAKNDVAKVLTAQELAIKKPHSSVTQDSFSRWVYVLSQNWRQGTVGCKERSDIARSNKKPWKQKGTGRARAGSARSPLWRGGGVTFGPQPRVSSLKITKKMKKKILQNMFFDLLNKGKVLCLNWEVSTKPSTSAAYNFMKKIGIVDKKITLLASMDDMLTRSSFANIYGVRILNFDQLNAFDLANSDYLIFLKKDLKKIKEVALSWT